MEPSSLAATFASLRHRLLGVAVRITGNRNDAEDVLQDVFCSLWGRCADIDGQRLDAIAAVSVRNRSIDTLRRRRDTAADPDEALRTVADECHDPGDTDELFGRVDAIIRGTLSERDREILMLRDHAGWEIEDIADRFSLPAGTIRVILSRARQRVRDTYFKMTQR